MPVTAAPGLARPATAGAEQRCRAVKHIGQHGSWWEAVSGESPCRLVRNACGCCRPGQKCSLQLLCIRAPRCTPLYSCRRSRRGLMGCNRTSFCPAPSWCRYRRGGNCMQQLRCTAGSPASQTLQGFALECEPCRSRAKAQSSRGFCVTLLCRFLRPTLRWRHV